MFFSEVQTAFLHADRIRNFQCVATHYGNPCSEILTAGQKNKLLSMIEKHKSLITLDELRVIIYELLCEYHQSKKCYYETQVEKVWRQEFRHIDFSPGRKPSRRSSLSRSPTPVRCRSSYFSDSSQSTPAPIKSVSEPELDSTTMLGTNRTANVNGHQTAFDFIAADCSLSEPAFNTVLNSEGNCPFTTSCYSDSSGITSQPEKLAELKPELADDKSLIDPFTQPTPYEQTKEEQSIARNGPIQFGATNLDGLKFDVELQGTTLPYTIFDGRRADSIAEVKTDLSQSRLLKIFHGADGGVVKDEQKRADNALTAASEIDQTCKSTSTPRRRSDGVNEVLLPRTDPENRRSTLSPEPRMRRRSYEKSRSRSRSPSTPLLTQRGKLAFASMTGDASYDRHVSLNERAVVELLKKPLRNNTTKRGSNKPGWVYAIRDPELDLVKIGFTTQESPDARLKSLRGTCKLPVAAHLIEDPTRVPVPAFKRLEELVHADLAPHRWYFDCACGFSNGRGICPTEHHEWYEVADSVAVQTIRVWRDFILQEPYGTLEQGKESHLLRKWIGRIDNRESVAEFETHNDHETRLARWTSVWHVPVDDDQGCSVVSNTTAPAVLRLSNFLGDVEVKKEEEEESNLSLEDIQPFDEKLYTPKACFATAANPHLQLDGEHLSVPSTPPLYGQEDARAEDTNMTDSSDVARIGPNASTTVHYDSSQCQTYPLEHRDALNTGQVPTDIVTRNGFALVHTFGKLDVWLHMERKRLQSSSIYNDLKMFRWPLVTMVIIGLYAPYAPPLLSMVTWCVTIPFFMAEMREWV